VANANAASYQPTPMQTIFGGTLISHNHAPVYPPALLAQKLSPISIQAKLIVNDKGRVTAVHFAKDSKAGTARQIFQKAVGNAVSQWIFEPLAIKQWAKGSNGHMYLVKSTSKSFSQNYVFRFEIHNGKPVVNDSKIYSGSRSNFR
jgi:hypothetical protein